MFFQAKYDQRRAQQKETILPLVRSEPTVNSLTHEEHQVTHSNGEVTSRHHSSSFESRPSISYESQTFKNV